MANKKHLGCLKEFSRKTYEKIIKTQINWNMNKNMYQIVEWNHKLISKDV